MMRSLSAVAFFLRLSLEFCNGFRDNNVTPDVEPGGSPRFPDPYEVRSGRHGGNYGVAPGGPVESSDYPSDSGKPSENFAFLDDYEHGEKGVRGSSLAFVFDSTGSMGDELNQVKSGAMKILRALRDHPDAPIYNYIWMPFNDPGIGPITVTTDPKLLENRMNNVVASGGGDCSEMSISALKTALEFGLPDSYFYVFTDAPAKDDHLLNEVLSLVQRKRAQVVFIITEGCLETEKVYNNAYERIAEASSGQVYKLQKDEVKEVLKYVKVALQPHVVSLVSLSKPAPSKTNPDKLQVVIDDSLKRFTVSVSGLNAKIDVSDPSGMHVRGPPRLESVLDLANIKVVNVNEPDPGAWIVVVNSDSNYTVKSTGLSKINFNHGFSTMETINLRETNYRPLKGAKSYVLVQTSNVNEVFNITSLDFVDLNGNVLNRLDLLPVEGKPGLYKGGSFTPPNGFFYLGVSGFGQDGFPIKRITSTAISGQLPEKPILSMKSRAVGRINRPGSITCHVQSVVPFAVVWSKDGKLLHEQNCSETCEATLNLGKFTLESEGLYTCTAKNVAGSGSRSLQLTVTDDVPSVKVNSTVVAYLGQRVHLNCSVQSGIPVVVTWVQFTIKNKHSGILHPSSTGVKLNNNTLLINEVKAEDGGWYVCTAKNKAGETQGRVLLVVKEPLIVSVNPSNLTYVEGDSARISCSVTGKPRPKIVWLKNQQPIEDSTIVFEEMKENVNMVIDYLDKGHSGVYTCNAVNVEQSASSSVELIYKEIPKVKAKENSLIVKSGSDVFMKCLATGVPKPVVKWFKDEREVQENDRFKVGDNSLTIKSSDPSDFGEYTCYAENDRGSAVDHIGLTIGSEPLFLQKSRNKVIQIDHSATISCSAFGVPLPEVKWHRPDGPNLDPARVFILPTGALKITKVTYEDGGKYVCTAENVFGSISHTVTLNVTGTEKPVIDERVNVTDVKVVSGGPLNIPCGIALGKPPGQVKWYKDGIELQTDEKSLTVDSTGALTIENPTAEGNGNYECVVENAVGKSSRRYDVSIYESPKIIETEERNLKRPVGGEVVISCSVVGYPTPTVTWTKDGHPLPMSSAIFQDETGNLIIKNLTEENTGNYACTAVNSAGSVSRETSVQVQVVPRFTDDAYDLPVNVVEGHVVLLNCNVTGTPDPIIQWYKNDEPFMRGKTQPKILRFIGTTNHTGQFRCVVTNEVGTISRDFNVTILVPPKILGNRNEETVRAKAGTPITLSCSVVGEPSPTILWQRDGMYLTQNTSDVVIWDLGLLTIKNVTKESAGAYTCDAENLGGITQKTYYLHVNYPPVIRDVENETKTVNLPEGTEYSLTCLVEGNPNPSIVWKKNGLPIRDYPEEFSILEDNTLVFLRVNKETTGTYKCEAVNSEGTTFKEYNVSVLPSSSSSTTPDVPSTKLEVNEGDSLMLTCPVENSIFPPNIRWIKNGKPLNSLYQERSDEAQMKLTLDQRTLTIMEAHPSDSGGYSCIATTETGRTDARFFVDVLMTPHFEEFNHIAHRIILTGGEVLLNCSVSGNPQPKVMWRKENSTVALQDTSGIHVADDGRYLKIVDGRVNHTGTYVCLATNKVNTKEREFYVTVLEPPQILGSLKQTINIMRGHNVTLECKGNGVPTPTYTWTKKDVTKKILNTTGDKLNIINAKCSDSGLYMCDITNSAGTRTKYFDITVLEKVSGAGGYSDGDNTVVGENVVVSKCKTTEYLKPDMLRLRDTRQLSNRNRRKRSATANEPPPPSSSPSLEKTTERVENMYALLAFNGAGVIEKKFKFKVIVPPTLVQGRESGSEFLEVIYPLPVILKCPVRGEPSPLILWFIGDDKDDALINDGVFTLIENELWIRRPTVNHSGIYFCLAENPGGQLTYTFNVSVVEPPKPAGVLYDSHEVRVNDSLRLGCNMSSSPGTTYTWFHALQPVQNTSDTTLTDSGKTLIISNLKALHSGLYSCFATNKAGSAETFHKVNVHEPPKMVWHSTGDEHQVVKLNHSFALKCPLIGEPLTEITWYKDNQTLNPEKAGTQLTFNGIHLRISSSQVDDAGEYKCIGKSVGGTSEHKFSVVIAVPGQWTPWSDWSMCSTSCGLGQQIRRRTCISLHNNGNLTSKLTIDKSNCGGDGMEKRNCYADCQGLKGGEGTENGWRNWGVWSPCSKTCGRGMRQRFRSCYDGQKCQGIDSQQEPCTEKECPVDGGWSSWSEWSRCSHSCNGGAKQRFRKCNSPVPQHGGKDCPGLGSETSVCNTIKCTDIPESGRWLPWSEWSPCSQTCGKGHRKRVRKCDSSHPGVPCRGENLEIKNCVVRACSTNKTVPSSANLQVKGQLNGHPINKEIDVKIEEFEGGRKISTRMTNATDQGEWFPYMPFLLSPLSWNTALERDNAENGYSLTDGNYFSQSDIKFSTGEGLTLTHKGDGVSSSSETFVVEIEVTGEVPIVEPYSQVVIEPIEQDFVQAGPRTLYSLTENNVTIDGHKVPYSWNNSIQYDDVKGTMPYLVETLTMDNISNVYDPKTQDVAFAAFSSIDKKFQENKCPPGLVHNVNFMHCEDVDECDTGDFNCGEYHVCQNTFGSYTCVCQDGFKRSEGQCIDVNECSINSDACSHFCHNTPGSYICSCPYGYYLKQDRMNCAELSGTFDIPVHHEETPKRNSSTETCPQYQEFKAFKQDACPPGHIYKNGKCKDYNECENFPNICDDEETCVNLPGSYQCISTPCPGGYQRNQTTNHCVRKCSQLRKCQKGAALTESLIYYPATLNHKNIITLDKIIEPHCDVVKTRFKVVELREKFQVRMSEGRSFLYPLERLSTNTLYRVKIEAYSYGPKSLLLHVAELIIFLNIM